MWNLGWPYPRTLGNQWCRLDDLRRRNACGWTPWSWQLPKLILVILIVITVLVVVSVASVTIIVVVVSVEFYLSSTLHTYYQWPCIHYDQCDDYHHHQHQNPPPPPSAQQQRQRKSNICQGKTHQAAASEANIAAATDNRFQTATISLISLM